MARVKRPATVLTPGNGLLRNEHFQMAYVTNDIGRASAIFSERYGIKGYLDMGGGTPPGFTLQGKLAWVGGMMIELIMAEGTGTSFYTSRLPSDGSFAIRHHHLGYFVENQAAWDAVEREIERGGWTVAFRNDVEGMLKVCYVEAPELGHYLEYIYPEAAGAEFFSNVPSS